MKGLNLNKESPALLTPPWGQKEGGEKGYKPKNK